VNFSAQFYSSCTPLGFVRARAFAWEFFQKSNGFPVATEESFKISAAETAAVPIHARIASGCGESPPIPNGARVFRPLRC
jgi:hypothetical protein